MPVRNSGEKNLNLTAFDIWNNEMAYALGLFYADGCLRQPDIGSNLVSFHNTDENTVKWWRGFLGSHHKISTHHPRAFSNGKDRKLPCFNSNVCSDILGKRLFDLGAIPNKSKLAGTMFDKEVALLGGVSKSAVCIYRKKQNIPSYRKVQANG